MASVDTPVRNASIDPEHPWLGLASFTEEMQAYFFGRDEEVAELARRVQRKLLTLLFGQSGLGKTSILRAGIVPRLRRLGYCPVYVRVDYAPESPSPSEQIKAAILRASEHAGDWTQPGAAVEGESLWEFLHHRDDLLRDAAGKPLVPLLIFDQFEEIFTLAQGDDAGRRRAAMFIEDLADLVENRPPKSLEARMEEDESVAERFDFTRGDYRVLIALREDYLAHLEALKGGMPSITQNRMRIARMTGAQALAAVVGPGGRLVDEEVAQSIVRFVAGGAELANAEVEPSLLSLICRELNAARIAQRREAISADLLAGSRDTILTQFYERALADQPPDVRRFIEDQLLTESGYRESLAEERVQKVFAAAGAPDALATLVDRRLLRIEERLDLRRVELMHDVLCRVVRESRDVRHEREARDEAERRLAAQRERERATRKALVRARQVATACAVLAIVAVASALFGYASTQRAERAEAQAQATRGEAERARGEAEKLMVFLLDDFQLELMPVGRLDVVAGLAKRVLGYYDGLPPELRTAETNRNRALALVRYGAALRTQARLDASDKALADAVGVLSDLQQKGDHSEATAIGLSIGLTTQALAARGRSDIPKALALAPRAVEVLEPLLAAPAPSVALRRAGGDALLTLGVLSNFRTQEEAVRNLERARQAYRGIADLALADVPAAIAYAEASAWLAGSLQALGQAEDAIRVGEEAVGIATQVLQMHPGYTSALRARGIAYNNLADAAGDDFRIGKALAYSEGSMRDYQALAAIDPSNAIAWNNLAVAYDNAATRLIQLGRIDDARGQFRAALATEHQAPASNLLGNALADSAGQLLQVEADQGNPERIEAVRKDVVRWTEMAVRNLPADSLARAFIQEDANSRAFAVADGAGDFRTLRALAEAAVQRLEVLEAPGPGAADAKRVRLVGDYDALADAAFRVRDYVAAQKASARAIELRQAAPPRTVKEARDASDGQMLAAMIAVRLGKQAEAREIVEPVLKFHRGLYVRNKEDRTQHVQMARALYVAASAGLGDRSKELGEAAGILAELPPQMLRSVSVGRLRDDIAAERGNAR